MPHLFNNSNKTEKAEIEKMFTVLENPYSEFRTEYQLLSILKQIIYFLNQKQLFLSM